MSHENQDVLCFQCGQSVGDPPVLNRMPDGENCLRCAERVLESLPSIRPSEVRELSPEPETSA